MRRIFFNSTTLLVSRLVIRGLTAFITILVIRYLGLDDYGRLAVALAFAQVAAYLTDVGLSHTYFRECSKPNVDLAYITSATLTLRIILAGIITILVLLIVPLFHYDALTHILILAIAIPTVWGKSLEGVGSAYFQIIERMHVTALIHIVSGLITAAILLVGIFLKISLLSLGLAYGFSAIVAGSISIYLVQRDMGMLQFAWYPKQLEGLVGFAAAGIMAMILSQMGPILVAKVLGYAEAGAFSAAQRIVAFLYLVPGTIASAFYPRLHKTVHSASPREHYQFFMIMFSVVSFVGLGLTILVATYYEKIVLAFFGPDAGRGALDVIKIMIWMLAFQSANSSLAYELMVQRLQSIRALVLAFVLVCSAILYYYMSIEFGAKGGGLAAVLSEALLFIGYVFLQPPRVRTLVLHQLGTLMVVTILSYIIGVLVSRWIVTPWLGLPLIVLATLLIASFVNKEIRHVMVMARQSAYYLLQSLGSGRRDES